MKRIFLALSLCFLLSGCGVSFKKQIRQLPLEIQDPAAVDLQPITFKVLTKDNAVATISLIPGGVMVGISINDYKALAENLEKLREYIVLQKEILKKYRNYYEHQ